MQRFDNDGLTENQFLSQYRPDDYPRPSVTVDMVIFTVAYLQGDNYRKLTDKQLQIFLIRRGGHPYLGQWALPGGFVRPNETVGEAAYRELKEETDVQGGYLEQLFTFSTPERDPRTWVISCAHMALVDSEQLTLAAGSDASDAKWFSVQCDYNNGVYTLSLINGDVNLSAVIKLDDVNAESELIENNGLAFDHAKMIECAIRRLRSKLEYTDLAFSLMPERFTLTGLQQVYEVILDKPLYKAAFRRKMAGLVLETDQHTADKGHRPAKLYTKHEKEG
jgi:ADP-ribose pyrophosphatase YjhB (NUDIX family)